MAVEIVVVLFNLTARVVIVSAVYDEIVAVPVVGSVLVVTVMVEMVAVSNPCA